MKCDASHPGVFTCSVITRALFYGLDRHLDGEQGRSIAGARAGAAKGAHLQELGTCNCSTALPCRRLPPRGARPIGPSIAVLHFRMKKVRNVDFWH